MSLAHFTGLVMNEQEAQKAAFKKWGDLNKHRLSIDHKYGHEQGWDDAIEWIKQRQEPVAWRWLYNGRAFDNGWCEGPLPEKDIIRIAESNSRTLEVAYTHPAPPPEVAELIEAGKLALEYFRHRQQQYKNIYPFWFMPLEEAISKLEVKI